MKIGKNVLEEKWRKARYPLPSEAIKTKTYKKRYEYYRKQGHSHAYANELAVNDAIRVLRIRRGGKRVTRKDILGSTSNAEERKIVIDSIKKEIRELRTILGSASNTEERKSVTDAIKKAEKELTTMSTYGPKFHKRGVYRLIDGKEHQLIYVGDSEGAKKVKAFVKKKYDYHPRELFEDGEHLLYVLTGDKTGGKKKSRLAKAENILRSYGYKLSKIPKKTRKKLDDLVTKQELQDLLKFGGKYRAPILTRKESRRRYDRGEQTSRI